jgi:hypothetical protein
MLAEIEGLRPTHVGARHVRFAVLTREKWST